MRIHYKSTKGDGVSYEPWFKALQELLKEKKVEPLLKTNELSMLYHKDYRPEDVYYILRTRTATSGIVNVSWFDAFGRESISFSHNEQIRHFYKLNPDIKRVMDWPEDRKK